MINQEQFYQLLHAGKWIELTRLLYSHKELINSDYMLGHAAKIFEHELVRRVSEYPIGSSDVFAALENLYLLHKGKYYALEPNVMKVVLIELIKRSPLTIAYNYAMEIPEEEIAKNTIEQYRQLKSEELSNQQHLITPMNWIELFNRFFALINNQENAETYFGGPRFISVIKEVRPYFPDYGQYIKVRTEQGKSTSRKVYYYDLLIELPEEQRNNVVNRILDIVERAEPEKVAIIRRLLAGKPVGTKIIKEKDNVSVNPIISQVNPIVFISYTWDGDEHKKWVLNLADRLMSNGVDVLLDQYELRLGKSLPHFVENAIATAERIIVIFTPNYKIKADGRKGGAGYEYSIINAALYSDQVTNKKIIPMLRYGTMQESIPAFMQQYIHLDVTNDENFENSYTDLLRDIYNEPAIKKPALGQKPTF